LKISIWLRVAFDWFLSSESRSLMSIKDLGEFKYSAVESFRSVPAPNGQGIDRKQLTVSVMGRRRRLIEGWNVPTL
jgi:hypothetical protein